VQSADTALHEGLAFRLEAAKFYLVLDRYIPPRVWWLAAATLLTLVIGWAMSAAVDSGAMSVPEWIRGLVLCIGVLALWGLGFRWRLFNRSFWRYFLVLDIGTCIIEVLTPEANVRSHSPGLVVFLIMIYTPYYLGMYQYGFRSDDIWRSESRARRIPPPRTSQVATEQHNQTKRDREE